MRVSFKKRIRRFGFTLVELVVALVVLAIGAVTFVTLINQATLTSVDPMNRVQGNIVAQSYLEEILQQPFCDPDLAIDCPAACLSACSTNCSSAEGSRDLYDDVFDYHNLNQAPTDRNDNPIPNLGDYNVVVSVVESGVTLDTLSSATCRVVRVDIDVTHTPTSTAMNVSGFKVNF